MERVLGITRDGSELRLAVAGDWKLSKGLPSIETVARAVALDPPEDVDPAVGLRRGELGDTGTPDVLRVLVLAPGIEHIAADPSFRARELRRDRLLGAVDGDDHRLAGLGILAGEDQQVAVVDQPAVGAAPERDVSASNGDQPAIVRRSSSSRGRPCRAGRRVVPRHVSAIVGPLVAQPSHFLPVADHRDADGGELEDGGETKPARVTPQLVQRGRLVVRREVVREVVAVTDVVALFQVRSKATVRPRPWTKASVLPLNVKSKPASISSSSN